MLGWYLHLPIDTVFPSAGFRWPQNPPKYQATQIWSVGATFPTQRSITLVVIVMCVTVPVCLWQCCSFSLFCLLFEYVLSLPRWKDFAKSPRQAWLPAGLEMRMWRWGCWTAYFQNPEQTAFPLPHRTLCAPHSVPLPHPAFWDLKDQQEACYVWLAHLVKVGILFEMCCFTNFTISDTSKLIPLGCSKLLPFHTEISHITFAAS